jgi:hypothetical protein
LNGIKRSFFRDALACAASGLIGQRQPSLYTRGRFSMILTCKIIGVHHASQFTDEQERITVAVAEADSIARELRLINHNGLKLGDEFTLTLPAARFVTSEPNRGQAGNYTQGSGV